MQKFRHYYLYFTVFVTGAVVLIIEILGTRILAPFYGSTIFVWSSLLSVALGFLALGYLVGGNWVDRKPSSTNFYGVVFLAAITLVLAIKLNQIVLVFSDQFGLKFGPLIASILLFAIPLFLLGMVTPFAIRLRTKLIENVGTRSGSIFAIATIGSLTGALLSGFFLIPLLSIISIFYITASFLAVMSIFGFIISDKEKSKEKRYGYFLLILAFFIILSTPLFNVEAHKDLKILFQKQSFYGDIKVVEIGESRCLVVNGASQTCVKKDGENSPYIKEMGRISVLRSQDKEILILGLGGGGILHFFSENQKIDIIEIAPEIVRTAERFFNFNPGPNQRIIVDDARSFLRKTDKRYDFIIADVFSATSVPPHLSTKEYFELLRDHLNPNGLILFNIISRTGHEDQYTAAFVRTLRSVFPSVIITIPAPGLKNMILHASVDESYTPHIGEIFYEVLVNDNTGVLLTDVRNPLELLALPNLETLRMDFKSFGGFELFFVN